MKYQKPQMTLSAPATKVIHGMDGKPSTLYVDAESGRPNALTVGAYEADE